MVKNTESFIIKSKEIRQLLMAVREVLKTK